jgi:2-keto-4-pentenoate hydratase
MKVAQLRPAALAARNNPAMAEENGKTMQETSPSGITHSPIKGTTVRFAGSATGEKRLK